MFIHAYITEGVSIIEQKAEGSPEPSAPFSFLLSSCLIIIVAASHHFKEVTAKERPKAKVDESAVLNLDDHSFS